VRLMQCSKCATAAYCSRYGLIVVETIFSVIRKVIILSFSFHFFFHRDCQVAHWPKHKAQCKHIAKLLEAKRKQLQEKKETSEEQAEETSTA